MQAHLGMQVCACRCIQVYSCVCIRYLCASVCECVFVCDCMAVCVLLCVFR